MLHPDTRLEGVGVLGSSVLDCLLSYGTSGGGVATVNTVAALTEPLSSEALTV